MLKVYLNIIIFVILLIKITIQGEIIGFYQTFNSGGYSYSWSKCYEKCYTCNQAKDTDNDNCLSCNPKQNRYLLDGDINQNCYKKSELPNTNTITYILDTKQTPNKWVACHPNCKTCSGKETPIRMNCIECKEGFIQVNTFCYPKDPSDIANIAFKVGTATKYCGEYVDDETKQQLGIFEGGNKCIIKPDSSYFPQKNVKKLLRNCGDTCTICEGIEGDSDDSKSKCLKCRENYINYNEDLNDCRCPKYYGLEGTTKNCVNCKYSPYGPYNLNGQCTDTRVISPTEKYKLINTTYNILSKCNRPCLECDADGKCTSCAPNYFLNQIAIDNSITDNNEICLTYKECLFIGIEANVHFSECKFCTENNKYKRYNQYECIEIIGDIKDLGYYYLKSDKYHAVEQCHERCEKCNGMPKGDNYQNCETCKDATNYQINPTTTNCDLIPHEEEEIEEEEIKCKDELFYIDDEATEDKIKCIEGDKLCPYEYQYLLKNVELCVKNLECSNINYGITGRGNTYINDVGCVDFNNLDDKFEEILKKERFHFSKNLNYLNEYWDYLDDKIKNNANINGITIYQLFNNLKYIYSEDSTFHFTKTNEQNIFIYTQSKKNNLFLYNAKSSSNIKSDSYGSNFPNRYRYGTYRNTRRISIIYLSECEKIIKRVLGINTNLYIMKLDIYQNQTNTALTTNKVFYGVYNPEDNYKKIDLGLCENYLINTITPVSVSNDINSDSYKMYKILLNVKSEGYEPFIVYSDFYTKICNQYQSEKNSDMNLKDRKKYIYDIIKKYNFCQKDCYYSSSDDDIYFINCICIPKDVTDLTEDNSDITKGAFTTLEENNEENYKNSEKNKLLIDINENTVNDYFNFYLMQCFGLLFSYDGFIYNYPSMIIIGLFILYLFLIFFYACTGFDFYLNVLKEMLFHKFLYREYWRIKKLNEDNISEENNISFEEEIKEKDININNKKIQNRTNTKNVFERVKKFKPTENNKWIRINKSSMLIDPIKDDQIKPVNEYTYKEKDVYKNKSNKIRDYKNDININNENKNNPPPKRNNNNYYHMEKNNDLINARTVKPITSTSYDDIQALVDGKQKSEENKNDNDNEIDIEYIGDKHSEKKESIKDSNNNLDKDIENKKESEKDKENEEIEENDKDNNNNKISLKKQDTNFFNKISEMHNTSPAIYIYNLMLENYPKDLIEEEIEEVNPSKIITKREYSFLNDGEINELDYDNSLFHDKRNIIRIYYSFLKYNCVLIFSFFVYEDFNLMLVKYALFINYIMFYLIFNTAFFNNNTIHNVYMNNGDYVLNYHWWKILLAFILSLIFIKLIKWWITFYRRRSLNMKLLKRYTDTKNEILKMISQYYFHLRIFFPIFCALFILFWYYVSTVCAVFRYSFWQMVVNWIICALFHLAYSIVMNIIPTVMRYFALKKEGRECLFKASRICSYFF